MSDKGDAYRYLDNKCTELGYESLGDFIGCQTTDTIATCIVAWFAEKQANGATKENSGLNIPVVNGCATLEAIEQAADKLIDDERMDLIGRYCRHCGNLDNTCQCWNDE